MALRETFEEYSKAADGSQEQAALQEKLVGLVAKVLEELKDPQVKSDDKVERMRDLKALFDHLPDAYYDQNAEKVLGMCVNLCDKHVYKGFYESGVDLTKNKCDIQFPDKLSVNMITFKAISTLLTVVPAKELYIYVKAIIQKEHKNAQLYLLFCEILISLLQRIEKKEIFINEILVDLLRCLNPALRKYLKYNGKMHNNEYKDLPPKVNDFLSNFEKWGTKIVKNTLQVLTNLISASNHGDNLLLVEDLVESGMYKATKRKLDVPPTKLMAHYSVLFTLDLLEGLLDCKSHNYFSADSMETLIGELYENLLSVHPYPQDYILNYNNQLKYRNYNTEVAKKNERDIYHLPKDKYDVLTIYNSAGISYLVQQFFQRSSDVALLSPKYKLKLVMPALHILLNEISEKEDLKMSLSSRVFDLVQGLKAEKSIENLNYFDVPLPLFIHTVLQYIGELGDENKKGMGVGIFKSLLGLLTDNVRCSSLQ